MPSNVLAFGHILKSIDGIDTLHRRVFRLCTAEYFIYTIMAHASTVLLLHKSTYTTASNIVSKRRKKHFVEKKCGGRWENGSMKYTCLRVPTEFVPRLCSHKSNSSLLT